MATVEILAAKKNKNQCNEIKNPTASNLTLAVLVILKSTLRAFRKK